MDSLSDKSCEQLLTAFQDGQKKKEFTETHPEHLAQADASQHFDTCPTVMTSHPVHTAGGNRWFVSSAIYHGCFLKHLPPRKRCCDGRWIDEHMRAGIKVKEVSFKCLHDNGICLVEWGYFIYFIYGHTSVSAQTSEICFLNDIWVTIINKGRLWFYAVFQTRLGSQQFLLSGWVSYKVMWSCVYHKALWNKTCDVV